MSERDAHGEDFAAEPTAESVSALSSAVLAEDAARHAESGPVVGPDVDNARMPGVGDVEMSLRDALQRSGYAMVCVLGMAQFIEYVDQVGFAVIAPSIQTSLHVSDSVIAAIGGAFGILFLGGSVPISSLADRRSRVKIAAVALAAWSVIVFLTGFVRSAFQLFVARMASGLGQSYQLPVHGPLLIDTYPIAARGRILGLSFGLQNLGAALGPIVAGATAALAGGRQGWRWTFFGVGLVAAPIALLVSRLQEPRRGRNEMEAVLGEELEAGADELPISLGVAFERLKKIRSFHYFLLGMASLGFALFTVPLFLNLILKDTYGLGPLARGLATSAMVVPGLIAITFVSRHSDALFRRSPAASLIFIGGLISVFGVLIAAGLFMPDLALLLIVVGVGNAMAQSAFAIVIAPISSIIPYRLRSRGVAMIGVYIFLFGSFFGAVFTGLLAEAIGRRAAVSVVVIPASLIGGALIAYGARFIRHDTALVIEELEEEREERRRVKGSGAEAPLLQVRNLDFSYGKVQVLFGIDLDVRRGETLALLGTNGAGKSTLLRVMSGLGVPDRGVVRFKGRTITYVEPEVRARIGIVQLMGGGAIFPPLTVEENLRMGGFFHSARELRARVDEVCELLPIVAARLRSVAGDLSGGEQQMLALAMTLLRDPEVLIIDELSLGLAPLVVQQLLAMVRQLKDRGITIIIVEQSLNVALTVADRALFMEKGQIKFEGSAESLLARGDLLRAVFLPDRLADAPDR